MDMNRIRTQLSAVVVWGMIPLAVFAGLPSTGCLCANGQFKFFCAHRCSSPTREVAGHAGYRAHEHAAADGSCCVAAVNEHEGDCCQHGATLPGDGMQSRSCCQPVFNAPSLSPVAVSAPDDHSPCLTVCLAETGAIAHPAAAPDTAEFDTGPPLDRVVAFRHLL